MFIVDTSQQKASGQALLPDVDQSSVNSAVVLQANGQPTPNPPIVLSDEAIEFYSVAPGLDEPFLAAPELHPPFDRAVTDYKQGFFQTFDLSGAWVDRGSAGSLGLFDGQMFASFALPAPTQDSPLVITPTFASHLLDGPRSPDTPARVYDVSLSALWIKHFTSRLAMHLGVQPGVYSDFKQTSSDAVRIGGRAIVLYDWIPHRVQGVLGIVYLDRDDVSLLPVAGFNWTPTANLRVEAVFPQPRIARRILVGPSFEDWTYLRGQFGGGTWEVERVSGAVDKLTLRDIRIYWGIERKLNGGAGHRLEIGYIFSRALEYAGTGPNISPDNTVVLRAGLTF